MWHEELPYSSIIGITNLIATSTTECLRAFTNLSFTSHAGKFEMPGGLTEQEYIFGDYSRGRYGWLLSDTLIFEEPIPCKGKLGLWTPDESTMAKVNHQISLI